MISNLFEVEAVLDRIRFALDLISLIFGNIFNHTSGNRTLNKKEFIKLELKLSTESSKLVKPLHIKY